MRPSRGLGTRVRTIAYSPRLPFEVRCRLLYWDRRRAWPTKRPVTFTQKLIWKMVNDRRPILTTWADKFAVRDYVANAVGPELLTELYAVVTDPAQLDRGRLPEHFVVKPNHASGMVWIVADATAFDGLESAGSIRHGSGMLMTTPGALDWDALLSKCRDWLATNYADVEQEWAYRDIPRKILVEELLLGPDGRVPPDYKLYVMNGRVQLVEVHTDRFGDHRCNLVRRDWTAVHAQMVYPPSECEPARPDSFDRMVHIAETLGRETDFVRVDLYDIAGRIVFGELTSNPGGPYAPSFTPESFDAELGGTWTVPDHYR